MPHPAISKIKEGRLLALDTLRHMHPTKTKAFKLSDPYHPFSVTVRRVTSNGVWTDEYDKPIPFEVISTDDLAVILKKLK